MWGVGVSGLSFSVVTQHEQAAIHAWHAVCHLDQGLSDVGLDATVSYWDPAGSDCHEGCTAVAGPTQQYLGSDEFGRGRCDMIGLQCAMRAGAVFNLSLLAGESAHCI